MFMAGIGPARGGGPEIPMNNVGSPHEQTSLPREDPGIPGPLVLASWFGLATGFAEAAILTVRTVFLNQILNTTPDAVWMAPVANALLFLVLGSGVWLGTRCFGKPLTWQVPFGVFAFLGFTTVLLGFQRLHVGAALLLAAGLAVQGTRFASRRFDGTCRTVRRTLLPLVGLVAIVALGLYAWRLVSERRAISLLPDSRAAAPNVLLLILDTVRAQNLSLHGYSRQTTPYLEEYSKEGVKFDAAIASSSWTLPSHGTMFTGRWSYEMSAGWRTPLDDEYPTLAEVLQQHGYQTAGFVANLIYGQAEFGLDRGFLHYEDYSTSIGESVLSTSVLRRASHSPLVRRLIGHYDVLGRKSAADINSDFLRWLDRSSDRPFFAFLNYMDAHEPYLPPSPFDTLFGPIDEGRYAFFRFWQHEGSRINKNRMSPQEIQSEVNAYDGALAFLDEQIERLIGALRQRGVLQNTLVIVTSDHGEHFGEHGVFAHGTHVYMMTQHVPLIMVFPGHAPAGKAVTDPVSLRDLPATIMSLIGSREASTFPGTSLTRFWHTPDDSTLLPEPILAEVRESQEKGRPPPKYTRSLVSGPFQFIRSADGREELYDLRRSDRTAVDPSTSQELQELLMAFRRRLDSLGGAGGLPERE